MLNYLYADLKSSLYPLPFFPFNHQAAEIVWRNSGCLSATNTAVARTSVLGLHYYNAHSKVMHNALEICNTTHPDPRSVAFC